MLQQVLVSCPYPEYAAGISLSIPLRNRSAQAAFDPEQTKMRLGASTPYRIQFQARCWGRTVPGDPGDSKLCKGAHPVRPSLWATPDAKSDLLGRTPGWQDSRSTLMDGFHGGLWASLIFRIKVRCSGYVSPAALSIRFSKRRRKGRVADRADPRFPSRRSWLNTALHQKR